MPQVKIDEFAFVLFAALILILIFTIFWATPPEPLPIIEPRKVVIEVPIVGSRSFDLHIKGKVTNVSLKATGAIATWLKFGKNYFNVVDETTVKVSVLVPNVTEGIYTGNIEVTSLGGKVLIPVEIHAKKPVKPRVFSRTYALGDFVIERGRASEILAKKEKFEIFRGYFAREDVEIFAEIETEKLEKIIKGRLRIFIKETNNLGNLIVFFNGEEIFSKRVRDEVIIEIEKEKIKASNKILICAATPGFHFWALNVYRISKVEFEVDYKDIFAKEFSFEVDPIIADNFQKIQITFMRVNGKVRLELMIKLNNQIIYYDKPPLIYFNANFTKDIFGAPIFLTEKNSIIFELKEVGKMEIEAANLIIYYFL